MNLHTCPTDKQYIESRNIGFLSTLRKRKLGRGKMGNYQCNQSCNLIKQLQKVGIDVEVLTSDTVFVKVDGVYRTLVCAIEADELHVQI
jgi:hypothetical protein